MNTYNDEWIKENYLKYDSWKLSLEAHNKLFGTDITYCAWKDHCTKKLKLHRKQFRYTDEMNDYLIKNYPIIGKKVFNEFNEMFGTNVTEHSLQTHCVCSLGLRINEERRKEIIQIATQNCLKKSKERTKYNIGDISYRQMGGGGYIGIKTENGWMQYHKYIWEKHNGKLPEGYTINFADGDVTNCRIENLYAVPLRHQAQLNNMCRSGNKTIKKLAIQYLELSELSKGAYE